MQTGHEKLINTLIECGVLKIDSIISAFKKIDRKDFIMREHEREAYRDYALLIGYSQTISQPFTVAFMLELLRPQEGEKILDIGSGSGWTTALLAHIVGKNGEVWGVEIIPELVDFGKNNLRKYHFFHAHVVQATEELGLPQHGPYDKILVSAADVEVPEKIVKQLKIRGTLVIPIKNAIWKIKRISKNDTEIEKYEGFTFVPLVH